MKIKRIYSINELGRGWKFLGTDYDYGLFRINKPKKIAMAVIRATLGEDCDKYEFAYLPRPYRGRQSKMDYIDVYCAKIY